MESFDALICNCKYNILISKMQPLLNFSKTLLRLLIKFFYFCDYKSFNIFKYEHSNFKHKHR